jgi:hypothetical protein
LNASAGRFGDHRASAPMKSHAATRVPSLRRLSMTRTRPSLVVDLFMMFAAQQDQVVIRVDRRDVASSGAIRGLRNNVGLFTNN